MSKEALDYLMGSGGTSATWPTVGTKYKGRVLAMEKRQQRDVDGNPETWDNGDPKWQIVFTLDTGEIDPNIEDDDGVRRVYSKPQMLEAIRDAVKKAGHKGDLVGGVLGIKYDKDSPKTNPRYSAPKHFVAVFEPPSETDLINDIADRLEAEPEPEYDGSPF